jgi:hypothetical protein
MGRVLVCSTMTTFAMDREDSWGAWLFNAERMRESHPDGVEFFAAIEVDARGLQPFEPLLKRLLTLHGHRWVWSLDDGRVNITTKNRLAHLTTGQNTCNLYACAGDYSHMLFVAADCEPPPDVIPKLLEVNKNVVAAHSPTYCLPNRPASNAWKIPVATWVDPDTLCFSAACVMLDREAFRLLRWRADRDAGLTDDPCLQRDAWFNHGWHVYVRTDAVTRHYPETIPPIEHRGHDMRVVRSTMKFMEKYDDPELMDTALGSGIDT